MKKARNGAGCGAGIELNAYDKVVMGVSGEEMLERERKLFHLIDFSIRIFRIFGFNSEV